MLNYTRIPAPRVTLVDPQTGIVANEWFRFFNNLYTIAYASTGSVTPGTYGSAIAVPQITVDAFGGITGLVDVPIAIDASQIVSGTIASARISGSYTGITGVGTLTVGTWNASTIGVGYGGTGQTSYTDGQLLIGNSTGNTLTKATLTAGTAIGISNGAGAITITNTLPDQTVVLTNGTGISITGTYPSFTITNTSPSSGGTVTSVAASVPGFLSITGGPITTSGTLAIAYSGTALPVANGGTNAITASITAFNNITGYTATGATGTTSTNLVFSTSPTLITPTIGVATATSINKMAITAPATSSTLAVADGKTLTASNTLTLAGTDSTTMTFPTTTATIARTDAAQTFTGVQTFSSDAVIHGLTVGLGAGNIATNTAVGTGTLLNNTTGQQNTAIGYNALKANTIGIENIAVGTNTLLANIDGKDNIAIGQNALLSNTSGNYNCAIGITALRANATTSDNTAIGYQALYSNIAADNTAVGFQAGYATTTSTYVTAIGYQAGVSANAGADGSTYIGSRSGRSNLTGTLNTYVGDAAGFAATGSNNTFIGQGSGVSITTGAKNTVVGRYSGNAGGLDIRTASNYVILSDGDGNVRAYFNGSVGIFNGTISPVQATTAAAPAYVKGAIYFDTTLNKLRVGGATAWETITSV